MRRMRRLVQAQAGDVLVLALCVASLLEIWLRAPGWRSAELAPFALLWTLPLLLRCRSALAAALTVLAAAASSMLVSGRTVASAMWIAMLVAFAVIGLYEKDRARAVAGASVGVLLLLVVAVSDQGLHAGVVLTVAILGFGPFAGGRAVRARAARAAELAELARRLERMQEEDARIAVAEERARIAAELNEVIARAVSAMTAQAGATRMMLRQDPPRARAAIAAVEETGREALAETRRLLGVLRSDLAEAEREPPAGLAALYGGTIETPRGEAVPVGGAT
jgi:signal transduction histidine kinase